MKTNETFFEALSNPNSEFRKEMLNWWSEFINTKNNEREQESN